MDYFKKQLYKHKAHKYYLKYKEYKKQNGGLVEKPTWLNTFIEELSQVYESNFVITGSGALAVYLNYYNILTNGEFNKLVAEMQIPQDVDFVYYCRGTGYESRTNIETRAGRYTMEQSSPQRSVTYKFNSSNRLPSFIKSFDLTCLQRIPYVMIDKYKVLSLEKLLYFYSGELENNEDIINGLQLSISELEDKITQAKRNKKLGNFLDLEEECYDLSISLDKTNNKITTLKAKINIVNILINSIGVIHVLNKEYKLKELPELESSPTRTLYPKPNPSSSDDLFPSNFIRRLFDSDEDVPTTPTTPPTKKDIDFKFNYDSDSGYVSDQEFKPRALFAQSPDTEKPKPNLPKPNLPQLSRSDSSNIIYRPIPYEIKFDFEEDV
jgi:hypothetical protein